METSLLPDEQLKSPTAEPRRASPTRILQQRVRNGDLRLTGAARPSIGAAEVLVATTHSVVSAGTERAVRGLASAGLVAKARSRPDLVRQVLAKAKADGPLPVMKSVRNRLEEQMPLGYSAVGTVVEVGAAAQRMVPGQRVATGGAGHAELQVLVLDLGEPVEIVEVARRLIDQSGKSIAVESTGLRESEKLHGALLGTDEEAVRHIHLLIGHVPVPPLTPRAVEHMRPQGDGLPLVAALQKVACATLNKLKPDLACPGRLTSVLD